MKYNIVLFLYLVSNFNLKSPNVHSKAVKKTKNTPQPPFKQKI